MRTIKFRGKRLDVEWVYGWSLGPNLIIPLDTKYTNTSMGLILHDYYEVLPESVGQWTGLVDRHKVEVYEHDRIRCKNYHGEVEGIVRYHGSCFYLACSSGYSDEYLFNCSDIEVIHDNPELMEVE